MSGDQPLSRVASGLVGLTTCRVDSSLGTASRGAHFHLSVRAHALAASCGWLQLAKNCILSILLRIWYKTRGGQALRPCPYGSIYQPPLFLWSLTGGPFSSPNLKNIFNHNEVTRSHVLNLSLQLQRTRTLAWPVRGEVVVFRHQRSDDNR